MFKHVLLPTDGSPVARKAIKAGIRLAKELGARVTAYYALDNLDSHIYAEGYVINSVTMKDMDLSAREQGAKFLAEVEKAAKAAGVACQSVMSRPGTSYQGIVATAKKEKCDVILMASHGRGELATLLLGSVTQKVLAHSRIPVLVYR